MQQREQLQQLLLQLLVCLGGLAHVTAAFCCFLILSPSRKGLLGRFIPPRSSRLHMLFSSDEVDSCRCSSCGVKGMLVVELVNLAATLQPSYSLSCFYAWMRFSPSSVPDHASPRTVNTTAAVGQAVGHSGDCSARYPLSLTSPLQ